MPKQIHLAAHFPGSHNHTVWSDPRSGSYIEFESFARLARDAERAKFDFFFLAEHLHLRHVNDQIFDLDVAGRPDSLALLAALSSVTERLGLVGTYNTTFNEPFELARQLATLDHVSAGRAAGNLVTTSRPPYSQNFRRGSFLSEPDGQHYERAKEFLGGMCQMWDAGAAEFVHHGKYFDIEGRFSVPTPPQGRPVIFSAGNSDQGREFAAATADVVFSAHGRFAVLQQFFADIKGRMAKYGRDKDQLKIMTTATFVLGDTDEEAKELANLVRRERVNPQYVKVMAELAWGRDLSGLDPDGPLPDIEPEPGDSGPRSRVTGVGRDPSATVRKWRELADAKNLSLREVVMEVSLGLAFVGSPRTVAAEIDRFVQSEACDGFILWPAVVPDGLDEFADKVVPLLVERGVFRAEYTGTTLREHLGLQPVRPGSN